MEKAVIGAGSPVAEGRGPAGPVAVAEEEEENLGVGGCEGAEVDAGRFWARDRFFLSRSRTSGEALSVI